MLGAAVGVTAAAAAMPVFADFSPAAIVARPLAEAATLQMDAAPQPAASPAPTAQDAAAPTGAAAGSATSDANAMPVPTASDAAASDMAPAEPAPVAMTAADRKKAARQAYVDGRNAYHRGDIAGAKESFQKAVDLNYSKGFGEVGPQKMLEEIAKKEVADAKKAGRAARDADVASAALVVPSDAAASTDAAAAPAAQPMADATAPAAAMPATPATGDAVQATPAPAAGGGLQASIAAERLKNEQNTFRAQQLVAQALELRRTQQFNEALARYDDALKYDPSNAAAQQGKAELLALTGRDVGKVDPITEYANRVAADKQNISFAVQAALQEASIARGQGDYAGARRALIKAQSARDSNPGIFGQQELNNFDSGIRSETAAVNNAEKTALDLKRAQDQRDALAATEEQTRQADINRQRTVASLVKQSRMLTAQGRNQDAMKVIDQILSIDPRNDYALGVKPLIWDKIQVGQQRATMEKVNRNLVDILNQAEESRIPISDLMTYPSDWPDLSARRDETTQRERGGQTDAATEAILGRTLPSVPFDNVPFTDVIDFLRDTTQANIFVNWTAIEAAGIDKNTPLTIRLTNVKFSKVLEIILDSAGGGVTRLGYTIDDGVITISTQEDLAKNVATRTYDIRDLLVNIPDFEAPQVNLSNNTGGGGQGNTGGGNSGGIFSGNSNNNNNDQNETTREDRVAQIQQLITDTIASESWKNNGGLIGAIQELGGQLIVTQTPENQTAIQKLLEQLRETRAIQVNIEARFLTVQRNFLEEVGVDFDFQFNVDYGQFPGTGVGPGGTTGGSNFSPILVSTNNVNTASNAGGGFAGPGSLATGVPTNLSSEAGTGAFGLSTGVSAFFDDFRATLFLRAVQLGQNATTLTAPKLTLFNGQSANIQIQDSQSYISDLNPVVGTDSVGYDPTISSANTGVSLSVQATVSADRKYVTMTLQPTLQRLVALRTFSFQTGQSTTVGNNGDTTVALTQQLQLPETETTQLQTTVSVPDRGTLLLGGQTLSGEIEREAGVPVLSKIPFLKRLFSSRGTAKDEQVLLILVKPTIIIQREVEDASFPLLEKR